MTLRLIVRIDDANVAAHVGGPVVTSYRTFDVCLPEVEAILLGGGSTANEFSYRTLCGAEVIAPPLSDEPRQNSRDLKMTCEDCHPVGYPTDETRCTECERRAEISSPEVSPALAGGAEEMTAPTAISSIPNTASPALPPAGEKGEACAQSASPARFIMWIGRDCTWWREEGRGRTADITEAGLYTLEQATAIVARMGADVRMSMHPAPSPETLTLAAAMGRDGVWKHGYLTAFAELAERSEQWTAGAEAMREAAACSVHVLAGFADHELTEYGRQCRDQAARIRALPIPALPKGGL